MHEMPVTQNLLAAALDEAKKHGAARVTRLKVRVGEMAGFNPECIAFYFPVLAKGTVAADAAVEFEVEKVKARCANCGAEFIPEENVFICRGCGGVTLDIVAGRGATLVEIDFEESGA